MFFSIRESKIWLWLYGITFYVLRFRPPHLTALFLFFAALLPRLPGLDRFLTSDENTNIFFAGSDVIVAFLRGDLAGTYWHFYPGVTMSWLDAIGMAGQYGLELLSGASLPPFTEYVYGDILSLLVANRLPYAILAAAAVPAVYLLARKLLPEPAALLGALLLAFDPFYLAHSRVAHGDAPVAIFMSLSALAFFVYAERAGKPANQPGSEAATDEQGANTSRFRAVGPLEPQTPYGRFTFHVSRLTFHVSPFLIISAIFGGLAALTKAPGQFMALFVTGMAMIYAGLELYQVAGSKVTGNNHYALHIIPNISRFTFHVSRFTSGNLSILRHWLTVIVIWGFVSLAVFILLWPAMWVEPVGTFSRMWNETFGKVNEGHLVYFFGQPTLDPGPWFYFYVIPFRLTPITLIGTALSLLWLILATIKLINAPTPNSHVSEPKTPYGRLTFHVSRFTFHVSRFTFHISRFTSHVSRFTFHVSRFTFHASPFKAHFFLWLFVISLLLFGNLSPKKQDRYLLPLFPMLDLLAAIGWLGLFNLMAYFVQQKFQLTSPRRHFLISVLPILILLVHFSPVLTYYPYYLTYFNPLMGGPGRAAQTTLMGWGEGMEQVATYLNTKPDAEQLYVASTPSQTLLPYFAGTGENFYTNDIALRADYVVLYLAQRQRLAPSPEIVRYFEAQPPEKVIYIKDVPYAKIYPGPKLILADLPPGATPVNTGLGDVIRLAGYQLSTTTGQPPAWQLTLYWHALAPLPVNYTISVRARSGDDQIIAQQDRWPVAGLLPTSLWRQGDYVVDLYTLDIAGADWEQISHFEVVVYDAATQETLGPPITLAVNHEP